MLQCCLAEMQSGWWWLQDPEELEAVARALHPRGIREKALHKHLTKHKEFLREVCLRATTGKGCPHRLGWGAAVCPATEPTLRPQTPSSTRAPKQPVPPPCLRKPWPSGQ